MRVRLAFVLLVATCCFSQTAESYRRSAGEFARQKSWDEAIASYRKALELEPNDASTHYQLGLALKYKGDARHAIEEFEAAVRLRPKWGDAHYSLGASWFDLQEQAAAIKELRLAISIDPANAAAHQLLGHVLAQQNNLAEAQNELTVALRLKPSAQIHLDLGVVEAQQGEWKSATANFRRAIAVDPKLAAAHMMLGVALRRQADQGAQFHHCLVKVPRTARVQ